MAVEPEPTPGAAGRSGATPADIEKTPPAAVPAAGGGGREGDGWEYEWGEEGRGAHRGPEPGPPPRGRLPRGRRGPPPRRPRGEPPQPHFPPRAVLGQGRCGASRLSSLRRPRRGR